MQHVYLSERLPKEKRWREQFVRSDCVNCVVDSLNVKLTCQSFYAIILTINGQVGSGFLIRFSEHIANGYSK